MAQPMKMLITTMSQIFVRNLLEDFSAQHSKCAFPIWDTNANDLKSFRFLVGRYSRSAPSRWFDEANAAIKTSPQVAKRVTILLSSSPVPKATRSDRRSVASRLLPTEPNAAKLDRHVNFIRGNVNKED